MDITKNQDSAGLVFITHGLGHKKEMPWIDVVSEVFQAHNFTVVKFDATNSIGESGGKLENATPTSYYQDLEDTIEWAKKQSWYKEPFYLVGHSLGSFCSAFYFSKHSNVVKGLILLSSFISGQLLIQSPEVKPLIEDWKKKGYREWESSTTPGVIKRLNWGHIEDSYKYDLLKETEKINCPVLLIAGEKDETTPLEHQKLFFDKLNTQKELHIIKGAGHTFREERELEELGDIIEKWINKNS